MSLVLVLILFVVCSICFVLALYCFYFTHYSDLCFITIVLTKSYCVVYQFYLETIHKHIVEEKKGSHSPSTVTDRGDIISGFEFQHKLLKQCYSLLSRLLIRTSRLFFFGLWGLYEIR